VFVVGRKVEDDVYNHLRKKGLVPEKERRPIPPPVNLQSFRAADHTISSIDSQTLWKVRNLVLLSVVVIP